MRNIDSRKALEINSSSKRIIDLTKAIASASANQIQDLTIQLSEALAEREAAELLPEHVYTCAHCRNQFQSIRRAYKEISGYVFHDDDGNPRFEKYSPPLLEVICPDCQDVHNPMAFLKSDPDPIEDKFLPKG